LGEESPGLSLHLGEHGIYELTHVVMFMTRFGLHPQPALDLAAPARLRGPLSDLIVAMCQERHWDLLGELLFSWECLRLERSPVSERGWRAFLAAQDADGSFPPPAAIERRRAARSGGAPDEEPTRSRRFALRYHTTLVALMACSCRLRRDREDDRGSEHALTAEHAEGP
jgi:hypothetical protein